MQEKCTKYQLSRPKSIIQQKNRTFAKWKRTIPKATPIQIILRQK